MTIAMSVITFISMLLGAGKPKAQRAGQLVTVIVIVALLIDIMLDLFLSRGVLVSGPHSSFFYLVAVEIILFQFTRPADLANRTLVPHFSVPLILILSIHLIIKFLNVENYWGILFFFFILQLFLNMGPGNWIYTIKKTFITITVISLAFLMAQINSQVVGMGMLVFLYWLSNELIPLGLDKDALKDYSYPLANRAILFVAVILKTNFIIPHEVLLGSQVAIFCLAILTIFSSRSSLELWKVFKRSGELFLIIIYFSQNNVFNEDILKVILCFNIYSYLPYISRSLKCSEKVRPYLYLFSFLGMSGLFWGNISQFLDQAIKTSSLEGMGLSVFYFIGLFWFLNLIFWIEFKSSFQKERKIDHLANPLTLSAIIIGVLISIR